VPAVSQTSTVEGQAICGGWASHGRARYVARQCDAMSCAWPQAKALVRRVRTVSAQPHFRLARTKHTPGPDMEAVLAAETLTDAPHVVQVPLLLVRGTH